MEAGCEVDKILLAINNAMQALYVDEINRNALY